MPHVIAVLFRAVLQSRIVRDQRVLCAYIVGVVDAHVRLTNLASRMEEALQRMVQNYTRSQGHTQRLNGLHHSIDHVRRCFEDIRPHQVEEVLHAIFAAQASRAESKVLDNACGCLAVHGRGL